MDHTETLARLDHKHVWHPFTPMKQWRGQEPLIIDRAEGVHLIDTRGRRYIDGVSSLWCNVHGHRVPEIDQAVRDQLDRVAHTTLLGLSSPPSIELATRLAGCAPKEAGAAVADQTGLNKVFYSDAGATALEVAFKMAVGYWHHQGRPEKTRFIGLSGAYHGDTTGSMSVGYCDLFHRPFAGMVFPTYFTTAPDACRLAARVLPGWVAGDDVWPSEDPALAAALREHCLSELERQLQSHAGQVAAIVIEPVMQGAAGMICQPDGFVRGVAELAQRYGVLLIADEVATGFCRTGKLFACEWDGVRPDILCVAKGLTGGYLPLAATITTDRVEQAFCGELDDRRTLYHGHTYTGNALACAAALASMDLIESTKLLDHIAQSTRLIREHLKPLRGCPHVLDVRQRGLMVGIELCRDRGTLEPLDFSKRTAAALCMGLRHKGLIIRPLGDVVVFMPIPAMPHQLLEEMLKTTVEAILSWDAW